jgi:hypothetical protein
MAASPMTLLRDFGIVVAIDVVVALVSALVIMPPLLRWTDRHPPAPEVDVTALEDDIPVKEYALTQRGPSV